MPPTKAILGGRGSKNKIKLNNQKKSAINRHHKSSERHHYTHENKLITKRNTENCEGKVAKTPDLSDILQKMIIVIGLLFNICFATVLRLTFSFQSSSHSLEAFKESW